MSEVTQTFVCPCRPGFFYKDLKQHHKSKMHKAWETQNEIKDVRVLSKQFENEIEKLKLIVDHKIRIETELLKRIQDLEHHVSYWKKTCEDAKIFI